MNVAKIIHFSSPSSSLFVGERICKALDCKFGAECVEKEPLNFECVCPVGTCADEEGAEVCGSDGVTYRGSCQLGMETCRQQKNITIVKQRGCKLVMCFNYFLFTKNPFKL